MEFLSGTGARTAQDTDQYGRRRSRRREWLCRASHPHDQGGRSRLERVPGPDLREAAHRTIYRRRVLHEADSFVAWLSDSGRVRGSVVLAIVVTYTFKQQFRVQFYGTITDVWTPEHSTATKC